MPLLLSPGRLDHNARFCSERIERILHREGAAQLAQYFPGLKPDDLRGGKAGPANSNT